MKLVIFAIVLLALAGVINAEETTTARFQACLIKNGLYEYYEYLWSKDSKCYEEIYNDLSDYEACGYYFENIPQEADLVWAVQLLANFETCYSECQSISPDNYFYPIQYIINCAQDVDYIIPVDGEGVSELDNLMKSGASQITFIVGAFALAVAALL